jgi:hypothetical protein
MTEYSPLPWRHSNQIMPVVYDANGDVACLGGENAALIVRSVNLLPEALAALERIAAHDGGYAGNIASDVLQKARQP